VFTKGAKMKKEKVECDICGDDLSDRGPLGKTKCKKCNTEPICTYCINVHNCESSKKAHGIK